MRASDRVTGVGIRFPLCTCTLKAAVYPRRRFLPCSGAKHPVSYAVPPPTLSWATGIVPPIDLSRDGAVGTPNCTFPDTTKPRDFRRGVSCWRYLSSQAVSSQVLSAEVNLTDLSRDGAVGIPNCTLPDRTKPRDFRRGVSCWRYLSSQAVSSQVLSAEANLTDLSRDGAAGIPNSLSRTRQNPATFVAGFRVGATYLPGPSPAKYCQQKRA